MTRLDDKPVFCIGDVHGHVDRLEALLMKAKCDETDCYVVQLGDLGHFGTDGSPTGDVMAWQYAREGWVDYVIWGNHDRAVVDQAHRFVGYQNPTPEVQHIMKLMEQEGRVLFAIEAHGWLLTHAGLHKQFKYNKAPVNKFDPGEIADWLNKHRDLDFTVPPDRATDKDLFACVNAIGGKRGGWSPYGGILWRDISEKLYGVPQVFGHSASQKHKVRGERDNWWCIDIGGKGGRDDPAADCLAGIWLPSQEIVQINMNDDEDTEKTVISSAKEES